MKDVLKYIGIACLVVLLEWIWLVLFPSWMNGLSQTEAMITGVGFFLAFEMVICTGVILSKRKK